MAKESIATLKAQLEQSRIRTIEEVRRHEDTRKELESLRLAMAAKDDDTKGNEAAEAQRVALAVQLFPQDEPDSVTWADLRSWANTYRKDDGALLLAARNLAERADLDTAMDTAEIIEALMEYVTEAEGAKETLGEFPEESAADWAAFAKDHPDMDPNTLDNVFELLELLGMSGHRLVAVLSSSDMEGALRRY